MKVKSSNNGGRVRVLFFDHVATLSGGEIALLNLVQHLDASLVEPIVVLGEEGALADRLRSYAEVHILQLEDAVRNARKEDLGILNLTNKILFTIVPYVIHLARFIRRNSVDIVHTNSLKADILGGFAAKLARTPLVWHVRDRIADDYLPSTVATIFNRMAAWFPDLIIANSYATAATLSRARLQHIHVVHDGTILSTLTQPVLLPSGQLINEPIIGLIGRISPWKGQDVFLRAAALIRARVPAARFRIIGSAMFGEVEYEKGLIRLARELELCDVLTFVGFRHDVHQAITELDVLVHASTKPEPFGQVVIEGMAAARPVVATNAGGIPEIIEHSVTGLLIPMNDPIGMGEAVCTLLSDPEKARAMGLRARSHVFQNFRIEMTAGRILALYKVLLA